MESEQQLRTAQLKLAFWKADTSSREFKVSRFPAAIERRAFGAVDAEIDEPSLTGQRLKLSVFVPLWGVGPEVEIDAVPFHSSKLEQRAQGCLSLSSHNLASSFRIIECD